MYNSFMDTLSSIFHIIFSPFVLFSTLNIGLLIAIMYLWNRERRVKLHEVVENKSVVIFLQCFLFPCIGTLLGIAALYYGVFFPDGGADGLDGFFLSWALAVLCAFIIIWYGAYRLMIRGLRNMLILTIVSLGLFSLSLQKYGIPDFRNIEPSSVGEAPSMTETSRGFSKDPAKESEYLSEESIKELMKTENVQKYNFVNKDKALSATLQVFFDNLSDDRGLFFQTKVDMNNGPYSRTCELAGIAKKVENENRYHFLESKGGFDNEKDTYKPCELYFSISTDENNIKMIESIEDSYSCSEYCGVGFGFGTIEFIRR